MAYIKHFPSRYGVVHGSLSNVLPVCQNLIQTLRICMVTGYGCEHEKYMHFIVLFIQMQTNRQVLHDQEIVFWPSSLFCPYIVLHRTGPISKLSHVSLSDMFQVVLSRLEGDKDFLAEDTPRSWNPINHEGSGVHEKVMRGTEITPYPWTGQLLMHNLVKNKGREIYSQQGPVSEVWIVRLLALFDLSKWISDSLGLPDTAMVFPFCGRIINSVIRQNDNGNKRCNSQGFFAIVSHSVATFVHISGILLFCVLPWGH